MSLKRTPPKANAPLENLFKTPVHYASDSNAEQHEYESGSSTSTSKVRKTNKRKRPESSDISKNEILQMFNSLREDQEVKFSALLQSTNEIKTVMTSMSQMFDEIVSRVHTVETANKDLQNRVKYLESQLEVQSKEARRTSIEIRNVPHGNKETKRELTDIISKLADCLNISIETSEIKDVYRINTKATLKPIIAEFTTALKRDSFVSAYKKYNSEHKQNHLNTGNLRIIGPACPVYLSESLTLKDRRLHFNARKFAVENNYQFCWVSRGKIYLREIEGKPAFQVNSDADLEKLKMK